MAFEQGLAEGKKDRPRGEWIPCSERLPDQCGHYLVTVETIALSYEGHEKIRILDMWSFDEDGWLPHGQEEALAWMPLPDPYEPEEEPKEEE